MHPESTSSSLCEPPRKIDLRDWHRVPRSVGTLLGVAIAASSRHRICEAVRLSCKPALSQQKPSSTSQRGNTSAQGVRVKASFGQDEMGGHAEENFSNSAAQEFLLETI